MVLAAFIMQAGGMRASIPSLIAGAGWFSKGILLILLAVSVYAWAVMWNRHRLYTRVERADRDFLASFRRLKPNQECRLVCEQHPQSLIARVALAGQRALDHSAPVAGARRSDRHEGAQRAMDRSANEESAVLERHIGFLATVGSVSPFVGLLGTVWGVMSAFLNIGTQGSASLVVVAPGIAEALIATVAGLGAAIPAVVGYNHILGRLRELSQSTQQFTSEFLDRRLGGTAS